MAPGPQVGDGALSINTAGTNTTVGYLITKWDAQNGVRELIVANKGTLTVPIDLSAFDLAYVGANNHSTPRDAEDWARGQLGITRLNSDRWFIEGDTPSSQGSFAAPPSGFTQRSLVGTKLTSSGTNYTAWVCFDNAVSGSVNDIWEAIGRVASPTLPVDPATETIFEATHGVAITKASDIDDFVGNYLGSYDRFLFEGTSTKISGLAPASWY